MKMETKIFLIILTMIAVSTGNHQAKAQDKENNTQLEAVYSSYFVLKDALVKSDGTSAQRAAELLHNNISVVSTEQLST